MTSAGTSTSTTSVFPGDFDEKIVRLQFYGRNECRHVELNGWTAELPIKFCGLKEDLIIRTITPQTTPEDQPRELSSTLRSVVKLRELATKAGSTRSMITYPVMVQVFAKKNLNSIWRKDGTVLMFGSLVVGDETGFCELEVPNDGICTLYQQVEIGSRLLIGAASMVENFVKDGRFRLCFDDSNHLSLHLKLSNYNCRRVFKLHGFGQFNLDFPNCYEKGRKIFTVSDLTTPSLKSCPALEDKSEFYHFDVIGVISHVGRLERFLRFEGEKDNGNGETVKVKFYNAYRWIELVDKNSPCTLPLQFYVSHDSWGLQPSVVPGSLVIVTNVCRQCGDTYHPIITTSRFSHIFINKEIKSYVKLIPSSSRPVVAQFLGQPNSTGILTRIDITWTAGGTYPRPFEDENMFVAYWSKINPSWNYTKSILKLFRPNCEASLSKRQSRRFIFRGYIRKYSAVKKLGRLSVFTRNENREMLDDCDNEYLELNTSDVFEPFRNWYMFPRELPKVDLNSFPRSTADKYVGTELYESLSADYKKYCDPLLMPVRGDIRLLKDLPENDPECFIVQIVNQNIDPYEQYLCIWKPSRFLSFEQMNSKLEASVNAKSVLFMVDVHYIDDVVQVVGKKQKSKHMIEIILQDFTLCHSAINLNNNAEPQLQN